MRVVGQDVWNRVLWFEISDEHDCYCYDSHHERVPKYYYWKMDVLQLASGHSIEGQSECDIYRQEDTSRRDAAFYPSYISWMLRV